ncbi:hypothetical protein AWB68_06553 [Caballeronia choica]|jgi:hypothetical protein|uniref:Uncharacterized protein n=1 Tax=Caballeronia choica TaxID=326476 RepID=A0A158KP69_9BURK|nr:hypothetical protein [Caballeronia choica]SAL82523.1 hypothetical protein AWB68_06553 [Caballeronia choica]
MKASERTRIAEEVRCRQKYEVELAQGASHIASMLYSDTLKAAVTETASAFADLHGRQDLRLFLSALASQLEQRGRYDAVPVLQDVAKRCDRFDEYLATLGARPSRPTSAH